MDELTLDDVKMLLAEQVLRIEQMRKHIVKLEKRDWDVPDVETDDNGTITSDG